MSSNKSAKVGKKSLFTSLTLMNQKVLIITFAASTANFNFYDGLFTRFLKNICKILDLYRVGYILRCFQMYF